MVHADIQNAISATVSSMMRKKKSYYPNITGEGNGDPLQYSCLENPMDRGAWQATIHGGARVRHDLVIKPPPPPPRYH